VPRGIRSLARCPRFYHTPLSWAAPAIVLPKRPVRSFPTRRSIVLVAVSILFLLVPESLVAPLKRATFSAIAPVDHAVASLTYPVVGFVDGIVNAGRLREENERLREEIKRLREESQGSLGAKSRIEQLERMLQLHESSKIRGVVARVIVPRESNADASVLINAGSKDGIVEGFPVVDPDGLVGIVEEVSLTASRVRLVIDPRFGAGARLANSRDIGAVAGDGSETLPLRLIDPRVDVQVGELVVTSGAASGSAFPPDIPIGRVAQLDRSTGALESNIRVQPAVNLSRLEYVRVLVYKGQG